MNVARRIVTVREGFRTREIPWKGIDEGTLCRLPSLVDEIGLAIGSDDDRPLWLRETDPGFWPLFHALELERTLPADWYARIEKGERFRVRPADDPDALPD